MAKRNPSLREVVSYAQSYAIALRKAPLKIERVYLFGSYAKGRAHQWSDIDVCIISPEFRDRCHAIDYLWKRRREIDVDRSIEPIGFSPQDFVDEDPLAWEIKTTGIEIWPNDSLKPLIRNKKSKGLRDNGRATRIRPTAR